MKTLAIDDNPFALQLLARQLEQLGCVDVALFERAQDAIAVLEADDGSIGLVFCDLQMPDIDGVELVRHLGRIRYRGDLVLLSGEDTRILQTVSKLAQAHNIHMLAALTKPATNSQLKQVLEQHNARRAAPTRTPSGVFTPDDLRRGIDQGELVNHYQPKVALADGALVGVEALVRWRHPQAGLVYPDHFITIAEEHGMIDALTFSVLTAALRQAREWLDGGLSLQMAVNVSMDSLATLDFPDKVARLAMDAGIAPSSLVLEVTESRLMTDVRAPLDILTRLRLKRIGVSIDDFGTGYSSLAQLRDIPFDELKLDRNFINGASRDAALKAIVEATLAMAHRMGLQSVAEGIEEQADWNLLRMLGCHVAQGYFIAKPMLGIDIPRWRTDWDLRRRHL